MALASLDHKGISTIRHQAEPERCLRIEAFALLDSVPCARILSARTRSR